MIVACLCCCGLWICLVIYCCFCWVNILDWLLGLLTIQVVLSVDVLNLVVILFDWCGLALRFGLVLLFDL